MTSVIRCDGPTTKFGEIGKEDLQLILRPKLGKQVIVVKSSAGSLLPPGENFACSLFKVRVILKRDENKPEEEVHLVAKTFPNSEIMLKMFDFRMFFKKEIFFYEKLTLVYKYLDVDFGANEGEAFDIAPKFYGARRSFKTDQDDDGSVEDSAVILMQNLKVKGYYTGDKLKGFDLKHSQLTIKALAKFHALGIACKHHRPEFFAEEILAHAKMVPFEETDKSVDIFAVLNDMMIQDPRLAKYSKEIDKVMGADGKMMFFTYKPQEPWLTVVHMDLWTNNVLVHKDEHGEVDDIKFIDFQNYDYNSPMRDLPYFLCTSTSLDVMNNHFDELLDLYYETFVATLERMKVDTKLFNREAFDAQLKIDAGIEFFHNVMGVKFFTAEIDKNTYDQDQLNEIVILSNANSLAYDKWYQITLLYARKGWF